MRAAVDVMGGDNAPAAILDGCFAAAALLGPDDLILLVGDESVIRPALAAANLPGNTRNQYRVVASTQVVAMDDAPVEAIRGKPDSSIAVMCKLASKKEADIVISAGNTGACVAAAQLRMGLLPGVARPGIAVVMPTTHGPVVVCDVGANLAPKPRNFQQYAIMAAVYAEAAIGKSAGRVGLLSIGEEDAKGNTLVKESRKLLRDEPQINFIGNVEGRDIFKNAVDVVICDGFTGNVLLKAAEGMAEGLFRAIKTELAGDPALAAAVMPRLAAIAARHDYAEYGGAPLLGVDGYCLIAHGRSDARAIRNAIRVGKQLSDSGVNARIVRQIEASIPSVEE